jgi:hypothetical protein
LIFYADSADGDDGVTFKKDDAYLGLGTQLAHRRLEPGVLQATGVSGDIFITW